jgi:hypothetical protein
MVRTGTDMRNVSVSGCRRGPPAFSSRQVSERFGAKTRATIAPGAGPRRGRLWNVVKLSFMARNEDGKIVPAYARYLAVPANAFLTNAWRPDSHADTSHALNRIPLSFADRLIGNAFVEFWPDLTKPFHKRRRAAPVVDGAIP